MAFPIGAALGGVAALGGLFGGTDAPEVPKFNKKVAKKQRGMMNTLWRYSQGAPGSSPMEQAALRGAIGEVGLANARGMEEMQAALGGMSGGMQAGHVADALANLQSNLASQRAGVTAGMYGQFMQQRQNAIPLALQAGSAAVGARSQYAPQGQPAADPFQSFFALGQQLSSGGKSPYATASNAVQQEPVDAGEVGDLMGGAAGGNLPGVDAYSALGGEPQPQPPSESDPTGNGFWEWNPALGKWTLTGPRSGFPRSY